MKNNFFYKVKKSIFNVVKYPEMAREGVPKAFKYLVEMTAIVAVVFTIIILTNIIQIINEGISYLENECPDFAYKDGILKIENGGDAIIADDSYLGKIILYTNNEDKEQINKFINELNQQENGIIILSDKIIIKNNNYIGTSTFEYKDISNQLQINEFTKQTIINYVKDGNINNKYVTVFIFGFCYYFIVYFINTMMYILLLSFLGYLVCVIIKMIMKYKAIFNMAVYSMTLSNILLIIYSIINAITGFQIKYFSVMYISVASIYIISAIFILKSDFIKKQGELQKIVEIQEEVKEELSRKKEKEEEEKQKEKEKKNKNKKTGNEENEEKGNNELGEDPEGA